MKVGKSWCLSSARFRKNSHGQQNVDRIVVVIDEEHMFGGRAAKQSEKVWVNINPKVEIRIFATQTTMADFMVTVYREDVIKEEMMKNDITINPLVSDPKNG